MSMVVPVGLAPPGSKIISVHFNRETLWAWAFQCFKSNTHCIGLVGLEPLLPLQTNSAGRSKPGSTKNEIKAPNLIFYGTFWGDYFSKYIYIYIKKYILYFFDIFFDFDLLFFNSCESSDLPLMTSRHWSFWPGTFRIVGPPHFFPVNDR